MAPSCLRAWWLLAWACATCAADTPAPQSAPGAHQSSPRPAAPSGEQPITLDAASTEVDYRTHTFAFRDVTISQGAMRVQADHAHATGLDFANSRWTFDGHVRIDAEQRGSLRSDQAVVEFRANHIARATITGKPAEFEQKRADSQQLAHGHADQIVYDVNEGTVRLADDAWLSDGQNEISGPLLVYNVRAQRVQAAATPGTDQRVHIIITPHGTLPGKAEVPKPQPNPQP